MLVHFEEWGELEWGWGVGYGATRGGMVLLRLLLVVLGLMLVMLVLEEVPTGVGIG